MKWFKIYGEKWLNSSSRWELTLEQRALWFDVLAKASLNDPPGWFEYYNLEQLAEQFKAPLKTLEEALKRFEEVKKIRHDRKKRRIFVINWKKYQSEYERQLPYRQQLRKRRELQAGYKQVTTGLPLEERRGEERRIEEKEKERKMQEGEPRISKKHFFELLQSFPSYPFQEEEDGQVFDHLNGKINILAQTQKKITWWKENPHALKSSKKSARQQLIQFFLEEADFQNKRREKSE